MVLTPLTADGAVTKICPFWNPTDPTSNQIHPRVKLQPATAGTKLILLFVLHGPVMGSPKYPDIMLVSAGN